MDGVEVVNSVIIVVSSTVVPFDTGVSVVIDGMIFDDVSTGHVEVEEVCSVVEVLIGGDTVVVVKFSRVISVVVVCGVDGISSVVVPSSVVIFVSVDAVPFDNDGVEGVELIKTEVNGDVKYVFVVNSYDVVEKDFGNVVCVAEAVNSAGTDAEGDWDVVVDSSVVLGARGKYEDEPVSNIVDIDGNGVVIVFDEYVDVWSTVGFEEGFDGIVSDDGSSVNTDDVVLEETVPVVAVSVAVSNKDVVVVSDSSVEVVGAAVTAEDNKEAELAFIVLAVVKSEFEIVVVREAGLRSLLSVVVVCTLAPSGFEIDGVTVIGEGGIGFVVVAQLTFVDKSCAILVGFEVLCVIFGEFVVKVVDDIVSNERDDMEDCVVELTINVLFVEVS